MARCWKNSKKEKGYIQQLIAFLGSSNATGFSSECVQCRLKTNKVEPKFYAGEMITPA